MQPDHRLGPYRILERLGAGGMGEVFLAQDTRLGRQVAVKVLPAEFAVDPERLARFEREARAAAALNHPHIAAVFDVGVAVGADGTAVHYMVQEYLQGQPLRATIEAGRLPLARALALGAEIAEALKAAHRAGIVHRDLKPENVFVTEDGHAKVLDFGLAKLTEAGAAAAGTATMSPTVLGTVAGQIMGTVGYMAPEQIDGRTVDRRADVFAFGCLLFEMTTGARAFAGASLHETLHMIGHAPARSLAEVDVTLPAALQRILHKALAKQPEERYQHADDLVVDLRILAREVDAGTAASMAPATATLTGAPTTAANRAITWSLAATTVAAASMAAWAWQRPLPEPAETRLTMPLPGTSFVRTRDGRNLTVSPDGRHVVVGTVMDGDDVFLHRALDADSPTILVGSLRSPRDPVISPDNAWLAYATAGAIRRVSLTTGATHDIVEIPWLSDGLDWSTQDELIVSNEGSLFRVPAAGGQLSPVLAADEGTGVGYYYPHALPSGRTTLAVKARSTGSDLQELIAVDLDTGAVTDLGLAGTAPIYARSGHVLYTADQRVMVVAFDAATLQVIGQPGVMPERVALNSEGIPMMDVADDGALAYVPAAAVDSSRLMWVDRHGAELAVDTGSREMRLRAVDPRISPDGTRVVFSTDFQIWALDLPSMTLSSLTPGSGQSFYPVWIGNTSRVMYAADRGGPYQVLTRLADSSAPEEVAFAGDNPLRTVSWVTATDELLLREQTPAGDMNIHAATLGGMDQARPVLTGPHDEITPTVSADGRWLAYMSDETGRDEIWLTSYPDGGRRVQVSQEGGREPVWAPDGSELYYWWADRFYAARIVADPELRVAGREVLFERSYVRYRWHAQYDVHPDGDRFLMIATPAGGVALGIVTNWFAALRRVTDDR